MTPGAPPPNALLQRHAWLWDALPADCAEVACEGDPALRAYLDECGLGAPEGAGPPVLAIETPAGGGAAGRRLAAVSPQVEFVAVAVGGGAPGTPRQLPAIARAAQLAASPLTTLRSALTALRAKRRLRRGRPLTALAPTGDRSRKHGLGRGGWATRRRVPAGWVLTASSRPRRSFVGAAIARAEAELGTPLRRRCAEVYESGKLQLELSAAGGERYLLRLGAGPARASLADSIEAVEAIAAPPAEPGIVDRIVLPVAGGECGPVLFSLEPSIDGRPPDRVGGALGEDAFAFLVGLRRSEAAALRPATIGEQADRLLPFLSAPEKAGLGRIAARVEGTVSGLRGGIGHGDFWRENLLCAGGRLRAVIDWEWAVADALPLLDLFDFLALSGRQRSQPTPGVRFTGWLWPELSAGRVDPSIARYCEATGTPGESEALQALAVAYWLDRASRELQPWWDRLQREGWIERNVREPLALLLAAGW